MALTRSQAEYFIRTLDEDVCRFLFDRLIPDPEGYLLRHALPDGREIAVMPLLFNRASMGIGRQGSEFFTDIWDFDSPYAALKALVEWKPQEGQPEPTGWSRHVDTGRYRPGGDAGKEYVKEKD